MARAPGVPRCKKIAARFCRDRKSTRLNSSHLVISYAVFCLKKKREHAYDIVIATWIRIAAHTVDPHSWATPDRVQQRVPSAFFSSRRSTNHPAPPRSTLAAD